MGILPWLFPMCWCRILWLLLAMLKCQLWVWSMLFSSIFVLVVIFINISFSLQTSQPCTQIDVCGAILYTASQCSLDLSCVNCIHFTEVSFNIGFLLLVWLLVVQTLHIEDVSGVQHVLVSVDIRHMWHIHNSFFFSFKLLAVSACQY